MKLHPQNTNLQNSRSGTARAGFSLLEIILVTTLMIIIASLTLPGMTRFFVSQKLEKAAERVRVEMGRARVSAIRSGEIYAFMFRPGMTSFTVVPFNNSFNEANFTQPEQYGGVDNRVSDFSFDLERLPQGTVFLQAETDESGRAAQAIEDGDVDTSQMIPVLFYPDGSSQDAVLILRNEKQEEVKVTLRGLTALVTIQHIAR